MTEAYFQAGREVKANKLYHLENSSGQKSATEAQSFIPGQSEYGFVGL
jgi:hypothetical protein